MLMIALVTGGGGFLGSALVRRLVARGDTVRSLARQRYVALDQLGVRQYQGDVGDAGAVAIAVAGCDIVFHVAARAGIWGRYDDYYRTNVTGTVNVVASCCTHGVRRLVYTSSPSVVFNGRDMEGIDESVPYPAHHAAPYPRTKALAEQLVLRANSAALATVALRPHLIWGPGDTNLIPRILTRARAGRLRRIGKEPKRIDSIYIDNAADAHLLAADRLAPGSAIAGKVYFLSQGQPVPLWDLVNRILAAAGLPPVTRTVPVWSAHLIGWVLEAAYGLLGRAEEPPMTRFLAAELATAHWFNIAAARRDLGYEPRVSIDEGLRRLEASFQAEQSSKRYTFAGAF
jgi:nucleoside-diphosphate-sugar epimerase